MTRFILHGGFTREDNELDRSFYEEIGRDVPDENNHPELELVKLKDYEWKVYTI